MFRTSTGGLSGRGVRGAGHSAAVGDAVAAAAPQALPELLWARRAHGLGPRRQIREVNALLSRLDFNF